MLKSSAQPIPHIVPRSSRNHPLMANTVWRSAKIKNIIKETEIKVRLKEVEYKMVKESSSALRTAVSIFKGDPDKKFYFDESMEYIQDDMSQKLGEMKRAMDMSMDFINSVIAATSGCPNSSETSLHPVGESNDGCCESLSQLMKNGTMLK